jgi:K+-transporting ATPase ATPase C chain
MIREMRPTLMLFALLSIITGVVYPLVVTGMSRVLFPRQAAGSLIVHDGRVVGSELIGQIFSRPEYFWGRMSAAGASYDASASSGSNLGPTNPALAERLKTRAAALRAAHPERQGPIPVDLLTASASGLDPQISPAAAEYQVERVARARKLDPRQVRAAVARHTQSRQWGVFGEPRVNVLALNLDLDGVP